MQCGASTVRAARGPSASERKRPSGGFSSADWLAGWRSHPATAKRALAAGEASLAAPRGRPDSRVVCPFKARIRGLPSDGGNNLRLGQRKATILLRRPAMGKPGSERSRLLGLRPAEQKWQAATGLEPE